MKYIRSERYNTPELQSKIMGPNPLKLEEELLSGHKIPAGAVVCDLGSGQGLTSVFLAREYGFTVYAADLWSDPDENRRFFDEMGVPRGQLIPVKADASELPFEKDFFDAVVSTDSYNYFGRDPGYLDEKLLPFVKSGGYIYISIPGMKKDCHEYYDRKQVKLTDKNAVVVHAWKAYRICGIMLLVLTVFLQGVVIMIVKDGMGFSYHPIIVIAVAAYDFYCLINAVVYIVRKRKSHSPVVNSFKSISFASSLVAMLSLQTAMFSSFGAEEDTMFKPIMNILTGTVVCVLLIGLGVFVK